MNAAPILCRIAEAMAEVGLEAVMVGNAAAALRGAPVTTMDFDFMFRKTPANLAKLKRLADALGSTILRRYHPKSDLYRLCDEDGSLQIDFMGSLHGVPSFAGLRRRAEVVSWGGAEVWVANLKDILRSKRATGRAKDLAVVPILEATLNETEGEPKGPT